MAKSLKLPKPFDPYPKAKRAKYCSTCGSVATYEAHFDVGDRGTPLERYFERCLKQITKK
ncbi:hypothetical protein [Nitrososphaera sp.]|uniref:hypothetical protein n=1 Tax=Nitrososphaera sp. TaxID=1971748 RepID=UPI002EDB5432